MTWKELQSSIDDVDPAWFGSISERCVYLYMRYHADRKGVFRLAMTELAAILDVNRQTVLKHVETLMKTRLVSRTGHGRYVVRAAPYALRDAAKDYFDRLKPGDEWDPWMLAEIMWCETFSSESTDPRVNEALAYTQKLEQSGKLEYDEMTSLSHVPRKAPPA